MRMRPFALAIVLGGLLPLADSHAQTGNLARPAVTSSVPADRVTPMEVVVNGTKSGTWLFLERGGVLYAPLDAFEEWRVQLDPRTPRTDFKGQAYAPLAAIPGFKHKVDFSTLTVDVQFSAEVFAASEFRREQATRQKTSEVLPSIFLNYDINAAASSFRSAASTNDLGLITEAGISTGLGVLTTSFAGRNLLSNKALGTSREWSRLETTFTRDFPDRNQTLRLGDSTTRAGLTGRGAYFGGLQIATNFALTPGFVRQPLPRLRGISAAPSTVELYVNDVLRQVSNVPTGPFTLDNFPVLSGSGDARLVVRDVLGRETVISQSFLTSTQLLAPGLNDWSFEAGRVRSDLGISSRQYRPRFASFTWARGISDYVTTELRGEVTDEFSQIGLGAISALPAHFLGRAAFAASRHDSIGNGHTWMVGAERQGIRGGLSFEVRGANRTFRQLGLESATPPYRLQAAVNWTLATDSGYNFGLGAARIAPFDAEAATTLSANFGMRVFGQGSFALNVTRAIAGETGTSAGISLTLPLAGQRVVSTSVSQRGGRTEAYAAITQNPSSDGNVGWRALVGEQQNNTRIEGGTYVQGRYGIATADASVDRDQRAVRLGTKGGLVLVGGNFFATRRIDDSFALVEVAGYGDIGIGLGSQSITRTNSQGLALLPRLNAYQPNSVRLNPRELPLNAEIDSIEETVVPAWRSAVRVTFPVRSGRGALIKFVFDDQQPAPPGATVKIVGDKQEFYVARRGESFVTGLQTKNQVELTWNGQKCPVTVDLPIATTDEYPRLGPLVCKGVKR